MDDKKLEETIKDIKCGNALAYSYIIDTFQNLAFTIAYRITKNNEDAQEVVQDSFLKVFHNIHQYNGISKFHSWLFKIVFNTALSKIKKKKLEIISISDSDIDDYGFENSKPWDRLIQEDRKVYINKALEQLNESDGLVLSLYYLLGKISLKSQKLQAGTIQL
jgi:RNA polymerase sigma-70 factor (ECF subfamily)